MEMGCLQSTVLVLAVQPDLTSVHIVAQDSSPALGAFHFDLAIFRHLTRLCEEKHKLKIVPGTKAALRFLAACERLRKLLSQLHEVRAFNCVAMSPPQLLCCSILHRLRSP